MKNKVSLYFDEFAENYDEFAFNKSLGTKYLSELEEKFVLENCPIKKGDRVLDLGIGTGRFSKLLIKKGAVIDGVDISEEMIKKAKGKLAGNQVSFNITDIGKKLPYPDDVFDCVVCVRVLKYIPEWKNTVKEVARVLKSGGVFILEITNLYSVAYFGLKKSNYFLFKFKEVKKILEREGLQVVCVKSGSRLPFPFYTKINNLFILNSFKVLEWLLDKVLPKTILTRNILLSCKKLS